MNKGSKGALWLVAFVATAFLFQNCGDEVGFNEVSNSENPFGFGQTRTLIVDPNLAENRPPIQLTTVVDNSNSTQYIQDNLQSGFSNAIDQVQGFNVNATLHTMSHESNYDDPATEKVDVVTYVDANGDEVELPASDIGQVPANKNYVEKEVYRITPSLFANGRTLAYNFSKDDFSNFKQEYTSGISSLGTGGSQSELGLCTLFKKIDHNARVEDPENRAYHLYILATNEDDFTTLANCPVETRQETRYIDSSTEENCAPGDADCRFRFTIDQNPRVSQSASINYKFTRATVRLNYQGTRIKEKVSYSKEVASHGIAFQEREATYTYTIMKTCYNDGVPEDCPSTVSQSTRVNGSCQLSQRSCNGSDKSDAANLFGVSENSMRSCQVSCSDQWYNRSLPQNSIPAKTNSCSQSSRACNSSETSAVLDYANTQNAHIRNCSRTCNLNTQSGSYTDYNKINSCSTASRSCNSAELSKAAGRLGVSTGEVASCNYTCSGQQRNGGFNLSNNTYSCTAGDNRSCNSSDLSSLKGRNPGFDVDNNLNSCTVSCSENPNASGSVNISTNGLSCPSSTSCNASQLSMAASDLGGPVGEINSCDVNCSESNSNQPRCVLDDVTDTNLCSKTNEVASLCALQGRDELNLASCSMANTGKRTVTTTTVDKGSKSTVTINDLPDVDPANSLTETIAKKLRTIHGTKGFFTSFFIHPSNDPSCVPPANMSEGVKYEELAGQLGSKNANTFPVCSNDYSPALDSIIKVAIENVLTTFNLSVKDTEEVFKVEAIFLDDSKEVIPESEYQVFKKQIIFNNKEILKDIKTLHISVWRPE